MSRPILPTIWLNAVLSVMLAITLASPVVVAAPSTARASGGMVVSPESNATHVGVEILRQGGNAADATVAVAFALAVTNPQAGNLGGGGFLLFRAPDGSHTALDFREVAPAALDAGMFLDANGTPIPGLSLRSGLAVGVPGSVAGLAEIHRRWGSLPWKTLVRPAIRLARDGFVVYEHLALVFEEQQDALRRDPETARVFFHDGQPPREGYRLRQPDLAKSLRMLARKGPRAFYDGALGAAIVETVRARKGVLHADDLRAYRTTIREPLRASYRGYQIVSFPPPSSGGVVLIQMLKMLERFELGAGYGNAERIHLMTEIQRRAFADRSHWLGDPDHVDVPTHALLDPAYVAQRAASIDLRAATPSSAVSPGSSIRDEHDTLHFSITDNTGSACALTTTLNTNFGSGIMATGTGILLNNEIDDFALAPGVPNTYGLVGGDANAVRPGRRPLSSMTPTMIEYNPPRERPFAVLGSPGGGRIINAVFQVIVNLIDHKMSLQDAIAAPRFHHQWLPDRLQHEPRAVSGELLQALEALGHLLAVRAQIGNVNAIASDHKGHWLGVADSRRGGVAEGTP